MTFELGALTPYSNQVQRGYCFASFVPSRPMLGHQFTTSVSLEGQDTTLFSFTVPIPHETLSAIGPEDDRLLQEAIDAVLAALPPSNAYEGAAAKSALESRLPDGIEFTWPSSV